MSKKTFMDNPALQFISNSAQPGGITSQIEESKGGNSATEPKATAPDGYKINPMYIEKKSKRIQLVMQPSLYERAKAAADSAGISFNEYVHRALEIALENKEV